MVASSLCTDGFSDGSVGKESTCNAEDTGDVGLIPESGRSPGREMAITPVFLPGKPRGQGSLAGYHPKGCQESDMTKLLNTARETYI